MILTIAAGILVAFAVIGLLQFVVPLILLAIIGLWVIGYGIQHPEAAMTVGGLIVLACIAKIYKYARGGA